MPLERIAYVVRAFPKVSETFIASELAEVVRRGVQVRIVAWEDPGEPVRHPLVSRAGLDRLVTYDAGRHLTVLRDFRPQLIHAHFATRATAMAREFAADLGVPYTFTAHRYDIFDKPPKDFRARADGAAAVVTVSEANVEYMERSFGIGRARMRLIPCGIDTEQFRPGGVRIEPPHIVCVARLEPVKNHAMLLQACALLRGRGLDFRCVLIGDGKSREAVAEERARLGLEDIVLMTGAADQDQVCRWWQGAAIAVLPSNSEGMPVSLMEAGACGLPIVATAVGGIPEMLAHGVSGLLIPPGDAAALASALEELLRDPAKRAAYGAAAREQALSRFSVMHQVDQLMAMWEEVLVRCPEHAHTRH